MLEEGQLVAHIRLLGRIGMGGMGEVWEGVDERLGRRVAVKTIRRSEESSPLARARFAREARILSQLEHPNICRLYEYIEADDVDVLVLELVRGCSLGKAVEAGLSASQKLGIALGTCSALVAAHSLSVIHRDLKPENVMLAEDGSVKVLDFGIARRMLDGIERVGAGDSTVVAAWEGDSTVVVTRVGDAGETLGALTMAGQVVGTPRYMSPEQARGEGATAASDMFCLGLLLFELYTGKPPYDSSSLQQAIARAQWGDVPPATGIDRGVAALISELTALDPRQRLTAQQALERLQRIQRRPFRRLRMAAAAVAVVGLLTGTVLSLVGLTRARREAAVADASTDFLARLFLGSDPQEAPNPDIKARQVLDRGVERLRTELKDQPATRARLLTVLGGIYGNLGSEPGGPGTSGGGARAAGAAVGFGRQGTLADPEQAGQRRGDSRGSQAGGRAAPPSRGDRLTREGPGRGSDGAQPAGHVPAEAGAPRRGGVLRPALGGGVDEGVGEDHPKTAGAMVNLALVQIDRGLYASAEPMLVAHWEPSSATWVPTTPMSHPPSPTSPRSARSWAGSPRRRRCTGAPLR